MTDFAQSKHHRLAVNAVAAATVRETFERRLLAVRANTAVDENGH